MFDDLQFDEKTHVYKVGGEVFPSVTTIMKPLSRSYYDGVSEEMLNNAANRGQIVHNAIEVWNDFQIEDIPSELCGYFTAYKDWFEKNNPVLKASEMRMYHPLLRYAGTCDQLCEINGELVLIDYKTSSNVIDMMYGVQLEAYSQMLKAEGINVDKKLVLHLKKDGTYKEHWYPAKDPERWRVFNALLLIYNYSKA